LMYFPPPKLPFFPGAKLVLFVVGVSGVWIVEDWGWLEFEIQERCVFWAKIMGWFMLYLMRPWPKKQVIWSLKSWISWRQSICKWWILLYLIPPNWLLILQGGLEKQLLRTSTDGPSSCLASTW
jgi:hypothetical protein